MALTDYTPEQLDEIALTAPRYLSLACTQLAHAKRAVLAGDRAKAEVHLAAAKKHHLRSRETQESQEIRIAREADKIANLPER